jgi:hypothetical protein
METASYVVGMVLLLAVLSAALVIRFRLLRAHEAGKSDNEDPRGTIIEVVKRSLLMK